MSEANTTECYAQGRFGPPPVTGWHASLVLGERGRWRLRIRSYSGGVGGWAELELGEATLADAIEALVTEAYRLPRRT